MPHLLFPKSTAQDGRAGDRCQCAPRPPPGQERVSGGNEGKNNCDCTNAARSVSITGLTSTRHSISPVATLTRRVISKADAKDESVVAYAKHPQFGIGKVASAYNARFRSRNATKQMQASVWLQVDHHASRHVFTRPSLGEEPFKHPRRDVRGMRPRVNEKTTARQCKTMTKLTYEIE